jgi:pimeloyl-ACP methyl ester carboxylesterase
MDTMRPRWLPPDEYPFTVRHVRLSGGPVAYIDEGDGPTLLFVHAGMWSFVFRDAITRLRPHFRCVTLDFPGYGLSPETSRELTLADLADVLDEFVATLGLRAVTVVAHDLGGPVGLTTAARRRGDVTGLVLANTFAWTPDRRALRAMLRLVGSRPMQGLGAATNLVPRLTSTRFGVGRHLSSAGRATFLGPFADRTVRRRFHALLASALQETVLTDRVERATRTVLNDLPVLTIFGERNDPFGFQQRHAATFPDHTGVVVAGGNHFPMMDDPDLFATSLRQWHASRVARAHGSPRTSESRVARAHGSPRTSE